MSAHITLDGTTPLCCAHGAGGWAGEEVPTGLPLTRLIQHVTCPGCWAQVPPRVKQGGPATGWHCVDPGCTVGHYQGAAHGFPEGRAGSANLGHRMGVR